MRITDAEKRSYSAIYLALTDAEADELIDALQQLKQADAGWHAHVNDEAYHSEVTVYREDDPRAAG